MPEELIANDEILDQYEANAEPLPDDYDSDADAYAAPPPLPDGTYLAELSLGGVKTENGRAESTMIQWNGDPKPFMWIPIQAKVIDPGGKEDGKYASDGLLRSRANRQGANPVEAIYRACTGQPCPGMSLEAKGAALVKLLRSKPMVKIITELQGQAADAQKAYKQRKAELMKQGHPDPKDGPINYKGQKHFVNKETGRLEGSFMDPKFDEPVIARPVITGYKPQ